jgi:hypothetical protein
MTYEANASIIVHIGEDNTGLCGKQSSDPNAALFIHHLVLTFNTVPSTYVAHDALHVDCVKCEYLFEKDKPMYQLLGANL